MPNSKLLDGDGVEALWANMKTLVNKQHEFTTEEEESIYLSRAGGKNALVDLKLTGATIVWNQLAAHTNSSRILYGVTFTNNDDGSWTVTGTPDNANVFHNLEPGSSGNFHMVKPNHVYYMNSNSSSDNNKIGIRLVRKDGATIPITRDSTTKPIVYKVEDFDPTITTWFRINIANQTGVDIGTVRLKPQVHDLTQMFGATIADYVYSLEQAEEGSGMAWLKSYGFFTKDYYEYDPGSLQSVNLAGRKVRSKNLFNYDAWKEVGVFRGTGVFENNGVTLTSSENDCYTNHEMSLYPLNARIPVNPGDVITLSWDCDETTSRLGTVLIFPNGVSSNFKRVSNDERSITYTVPSGVTFLTLRFGVATAGNTIHYKNIMVRYASDEDATFKPYTPPIFFPFDPSVELRGLFKMDANNELYIDGDSYESDGSVTRKYGIVNLGTLNWGKETYNNVEGVFKTTFTSAAPANNNGIASDTIITSKYTVASSNVVVNRSNGIDKVISISTGSVIRIADSSYDNAADFKAAMNGVYLVYELNVSTVGSASPFTSPQLSFDGCVEEFVDAGSRDVVIPPSIYELSMFNDNIQFVYDIANSADEAMAAKIKDEAVPIDHSSSDDRYGIGDNGIYGHVNVWNNLSRTKIVPGEALGAAMGSYLASMIANLEANINTAKSNYAVGDQFVIAGARKLYTATVPISINDPFIEGGNCEKSPSLADQIKAANARTNAANNDLDDLFAIANGTYEGRDLTQVFASEIVNYSDEWAWIQARLNSHNLSGLRVGDYIPINVAANATDGISAATHYAEIAGINTYTGSGDTDYLIGYHIDWITRTCYAAIKAYNSTDNNNGTAENPNPFMASELKTWMDNVLYPLLDTKLKNVIKPKRLRYPTRYAEGTVKTDDTGSAWLSSDKLWIPLEGEVVDYPTRSTLTYGNIQAVQYKLFANSVIHRYKTLLDGTRVNWWLMSACKGSSTHFLQVVGNYYINASPATSGCRIPICFRTMEDTV